jgi:hypothetical protein
MFLFSGQQLLSVNLPVCVIFILPLPPVKVGLKNLNEFTLAGTGRYPYFPLIQVLEFFIQVRGQVSFTSSTTSSVAAFLLLPGLRARLWLSGCKESLTQRRKDAKVFEGNQALRVVVNGNVLNHVHPRITSTVATRRTVFVGRQVRGLKPTATIGTSLRDYTLTELD